MAEKEDEDVSLTKGDNPIPRIRLGEIGSTGLKIISGDIYEENKKELRHPYLDRHDDVNKNEQQQQIVGKRRPNKSMDIHRGCRQRPKGGPR